jgi:tetratricopeptide (TPR) repeat protein
LESVAPVCDGDLDELLSLVAKSLVRQEPADGSARYWMLETIREFAAALPDEQESVLCRDRHLSWFAAFARESRDRLEGPGSTAVLYRLEWDRENLRAALAWALERASERDAALALASVLGPLHRLHGRYAEAEDVLGLALGLAPSTIDTALLQSQLGLVLRHRGRWRESLEMHIEAERTLGNAPQDGADAWWRTWLDVKLEQAHYYYFVGRVDELAAVIRELEPEVRTRGTPRQELDLMHVVAQAAYRRERYVLSEATEELVRELRRRALAMEDADADFSLGFCLLWRGKLEEAQQYLRQGREAARRRGDALIEVRCLVYDAVSCRKQGDVAGVRGVLGELDAMDELHGYAGLVAANRAWLALRDGDLEAAVRHADDALEDWDPSIRSAGPTVFQWTARFPMLAVELERGGLDAALEHARAMLAESQQPLPEGLRAALAEAVETAQPERLREVVELARPRGYV